MIEFAGDVAIVTGAGGGIGAASAQLLAARGARVVVADIALEAAEAVAHAIAGQGGDAIALPFDLHDETSIERLIARSHDHFGSIGILHANAADLSPDLNGRDGAIADMDAQVWDRIFGANCKGTMLCSKYVLPHLLAAGGGAIVNTGSALSLRGNLVQSAYSASKLALVQLTRSVATQYGKDGVRCNAVLPGLTRSPAVVAAFHPAIFELELEETLTPMLAEPVDIANAAVFLASSAARMITGQILVVDGGEGAHVPGIGKVRETLLHGQMINS
ncbi:SDR family NAD(P)-dependent oxidoreductase [Sphingobium sp. DC-2]|uniref:SDR family NAD(P)-dependent oxidoreductase n=1 Tax=Sphingobium sp. DC-2 TaxID=1303256 RepID=UPI0004C390B9|nr:SDR family oxidoreductase [Sphingobium sp. DC-2]